MVPGTIWELWELWELWVVYPLSKGFLKFPCAGTERHVRKVPGTWELKAGPGT